MKAKFRVDLKARLNESFAFSGGLRFAHRALRKNSRPNEVNSTQSRLRDFMEYQSQCLKNYLYPNK